MLKAGFHTGLAVDVHADKMAVAVNGRYQFYTADLLVDGPDGAAGDTLEGVIPESGGDSVAGVGAIRIRSDKAVGVNAERGSLAVSYGEVKELRVEGGVNGGILVRAVDEHLDAVAGLETDAHRLGKAAAFRCQHGGQSDVVGNVLVGHVELDVGALVAAVGSGGGDGHHAGLDKAYKAGIVHSGNGRGGGLPCDAA